MFSESALKNIKSLIETALSSADYLWDFNPRRKKPDPIFVSEGPQPFDLDRTTIIFYVNVLLFYLVPMAVSLTLYALILKCVAHRKRNFSKIVQRRESKTSEAHTINEEGYKVDENKKASTAGQTRRRSEALKTDGVPKSGLTNIIEFKKVAQLFQQI